MWHDWQTKIEKNFNVYQYGYKKKKILFFFIYLFIYPYIYPLRERAHEKSCERHGPYENQAMFNMALLKILYSNTPIPIHTIPTSMPFLPFRWGINIGMISRPGSFVHLYRSNERSTQILSFAVLFSFLIIREIVTCTKTQMSYWGEESKNITGTVKVFKKDQ